MSNQNEYKSRVGLDSLYVAAVTQDDAGGYVAGTPEWLAPAAELSAAPAVNRSTQYADDQAYDAHSSEGETTLQLTLTGIPLEMLAKITGRVYDTTTGSMYDNAGTPPEYALGFRSKKSNGKYMYFWYFKGKFDMPGEEMASQTDSPDPKTTQITFTAVKTIHKFTLSGSVTDGVKRRVGDEDATNFSATGWFTQVMVPGATTPDALALSSSNPADGATGVAVTANLVLTFNNALVAGAINNVVVVKADGTAVACTNSLDTAKKVMTINPNASLDAASVYIVTYGVTDIYGQSLNGAINVTTA